jgi:C4-dicarboxylate transporter DctM subunit
MFLMLIGVLILLLLMGVPVAFTLALVGTAIITMQLGGDMALSQVSLVAYKSLNDFILVALPAFVVAGQVLLQGGSGERLFNAADRWLRHLPGGLAVVTVVVSAFFAAIAGSSTATALTVGIVASTEMVRRGYPKELTYGVIAASGTLGILIPPSGPMILYGAMTDQSVGKLFMAGLFPGLLLALLFILYIMFVFGRKLPKQEPAPWPERWQTLKEASWSMMIPVIILGGIYTGVFTPTEAASIAFIVAVFIAIYIHRKVGWKDLIPISIEAAANSSIILFIIYGALMFGFGLTIIGFPQMLSEFVLSFDVSPWVIFFIINLILVVMGMFLEVVSIMLITIPIFFPIIDALGFDPIWFAVMLVINLEMAVLTPPIGMNLFVVQSISEKNGHPQNIITLAKAAAPYAILMVVLMVIVAFIPQIATWLPQVVK